MFFGGNLLKQPAFIEAMKSRPTAVRAIGTMVGADQIMEQAMFLGTYPGITLKKNEYIINEIHNFVHQSK